MSTDNEVELNSSLRKVAEASLKETEGLWPEKIENLSPEDIRTILHDLRVHQIELEMQNEELRRAQAELAASRALYFDLYDLAPVGYCTVSKLGLILRANLTAATLLGMSRSEMLKRRFSSFIEKDDQDAFYLLRKHLFESGKPQTGDLRIVRPNGEKIWVKAIASSSEDDDGAPLCQVVLIDMTEIRRVEVALRESMRQHSLTLEAASDGLWDWNIPDGNAVFSHHYYSMLGYEDGEFPGTYAAWREMVHPEDIDRAEEVLQLAVREGKGFILDVRMRVKSGEWRWFSTHGRVGERDEDGCPIRMVGTLYDITERREKDEERQKLLTAVEQSANMIVITDNKGKITYVNPAFEKSTGYSAAEVLGKNPRILKSGRQISAFYKNLWTTISSGKIWHGEMLNRRKDGTTFWESATISPVLDSIGKVASFIAVKEDITDRKALDIRRAEAMERIEAANRTKSEFLAIMSHELRTPLNGVLGFAELLCETSLNEEQQEFAQIISQSGNHLLQVVNDILDFSSIEKGHLSLEFNQISIKGLLESSMVTSRKTATDKGLEFLCVVSPGVPEQITGDERRMCQILINLIGNAVKFTTKGSVTVRVTPGILNEQPSLDFSIEDTGHGIHAEAIGRLFHPFVQEDMTLHRSFVGSGLGLAISKRLAEVMGGNVTVRSILGEGSTFTLQLPLEAPTSPRTLPACGEQASHAKFCDQTNRIHAHREGPTVLVVEDDAMNRGLTSKMLNALGYLAEFALNGAVAVDAYTPGKFAAILMDMQMPVMDGLEATRKIRDKETSLGCHVPIIALTANVMPGDKDRCLASGMDEFLSKPFTKSDLAAKLNSVALTEK